MGKSAILGRKAEKQLENKNHTMDWSRDNGHVKH